MKIPLSEAFSKKRKKCSDFGFEFFQVLAYVNCYANICVKYFHMF